MIPTHIGDSLVNGSQKLEGWWDSESRWHSPRPIRLIPEPIEQSTRYLQPMDWGNRLLESWTQYSAMAAANRGPRLKPRYTGWFNHFRYQLRLLLFRWRIII